MGGCGRAGGVEGNGGGGGGGGGGRLRRPPSSDPVVPHSLHR